MSKLKALYLTNRFFIVLGILILGFVLSYLVPFLYLIMKILLCVFIGLFIIDCLTLFRQEEGFQAHRVVQDRLSNGDKNRVQISLHNGYSIKIGVKIIDEVPFQFQARNIEFEYELSSGEDKIVNYDLYPKTRGVYYFGNLNIYVQSVFSFVQRRYVFDSNQNVAVYPSFLDLQKYELLAASNRLTDFGVKKTRRLGNANEFEHIKQYVLGDDPRTINYKATARTGEMMVNTYIEERMQPVYCIIDKGRTMQMPFDGMTLLDYAINSALAIGTAAINKGDKVGLITFSNRIDDIVLANDRPQQKSILLEKLYAQRTNFLEGNYSQLYITIKKNIRQRSLIILYTNFETINGLKRQMKYLRLIAKEHLLVLAFFKNSSLDILAENEPKDLEEAFVKGNAESMVYDKNLIVKELNRMGVHTILSAPEHMNINAVNKYIEMKARGLI